MAVTDRWLAIICSAVLMWYLNFVRACLFHCIMKSVNLEKHGWIEVDVLISFTVGLTRSLVIIIMI